MLVNKSMDRSSCKFFNTAQCTNFFFFDFFRIMGKNHWPDSIHINHQWMELLKDAAGLQSIMNLWYRRYVLWSKISYRVSCSHVEFVYPTNQCVFFSFAVIILLLPSLFLISSFWPKLFDTQVIRCFICRLSVF